MRESYDPTPPSTWLGRARFTPLVDALRGQLTARLDSRTLIAAAELPAPLPELIYTVVRRTRLWRREKVDVARELIAHFADGLSAGRTPEQLATDFGPAAQAARLIRRGKIRNRPYLWHAARFALRAAGVGTLVFIAFYGLLAARFYFSVPNITRNYWKEANDARRAPDGDPAWPLYREALVKLGDPAQNEDHPRVDGDWIEAGPDGPHWAELKTIVKRNQESIRLTREAAKKPSLGYLIGDPGDREYYQATHADWLVGKEYPTAEENRLLVYAEVDHAVQLRDLGRLLQADAAVAAEARRGDQFVEDFAAIIAMSEQINEPHSFFVEQLVSLTVFGIAMETLGGTLARGADFLTADQLRNLAHRIAAYRGGEIAIDFTGERDTFDDVLQRSYTDDGYGDGHITEEGLRMPATLVLDDPNGKWDHNAAARIFAPGFSALIAGRAETRELVESFYKEFDAAHAGPPWLWDPKKIEAAHNVVPPMQRGTRFVRHFLPHLILPAIGQARGWAEREIQRRDAAEVVIALVLYHRRHGAWPQTLEELVPDLLPAVPPDRFDGQPLRYIIRDGKPVLYSIGVDRNDDGGRPTRDPSRAASPRYGPESESYYPPDSGDWILWPPVPATPAEAAVTSSAAEEE